MAKLSLELRRYFLDAPPEPQAKGLQDAPSPQSPISDPVSDPASDPPASDSSPTDGDVTLDEILHLAGERTFGFLFVLLSLPSALPIPAPGYSIPFGIVMALLAIQLILGAEQPWLPKSWGKHGFERQKVRGVLKAGLPWLERIEAVSRPRLTGVCTSRLGRLVMGVAIAFMASCMMIPIPGTNTLPAMGIFVTGFGLLDDDGAISLAGLALCTAALGLVGTILVLGAEVVDRAKDVVKGWIF